MTDTTSAAHRGQSGARRSAPRRRRGSWTAQLPVTIDEENGTLQLGGDILFPRGSAELLSRGVAQAAAPRRGARSGAAVLCRCAPRPASSCNIRHQGRLDAVYHRRPHRYDADPHAALPEQLGSVGGARVRDLQPSGRGVSRPRDAEERPRRRAHRRQRLWRISPGRRQRHRSRDAAQSPDRAALHHGDAHRATRSRGWSIKSMPRRGR